MESFWPENLTSDRRRAVNELVRGREFANQLKAILDNPKGDDGRLSSEDLVTKVFNSFVNTLSLLDRVGSEEVSQLQMSSSCCKNRKSEGSGESSKSSPVKDRRGSYKRRKSHHSWTQDSTSLIGDGYAWRKYGQKSILNAEYPRHYYRCTHKYDQECPATKQVQRIKEDLYRTVYSGHHTCKGFIKTSQLVLDSTSDHGDYSTVFLSFDDAPHDHLSADKLDSPFFTSFKSVKQETTAVDASRVLTHHQNSSSPSDNLVPADLSTFEQADVISGLDYCSPSGDSFDMDLDDMVVGCSSGFDDDVLQMGSLCM